MKKILIYLFLFTISEIMVYAADDCSCPRGVVNSISESAILQDASWLGRCDHAAPADHLSCSEGNLPSSFSVTVSHSDLTSNATEGTSCQLHQINYRTVTVNYCCTEEDKPYLPPEGNFTASGLVKSSCDNPPQENIDQQCTDLGGSFYATEKKDCCDISVCFIDNTLPTCTPPEVPQPMGGCACPADTYPVTLNGTTVSCMPNTDCDPAKGQVLDSGTGVCGCLPGFFPDVNSVCLPLPTDNNDTNNTNPPGCDPGQYLCYGQCQLMSVPCTPPTNPNDPTGGDGLPCEYPDSVDGLPYQSPEPTQEFCCHPRC